LENCKNQTQFYDLWERNLVEEELSKVLHANATYHKQDFLIDAKLDEAWEREKVQPAEIAQLYRELHHLMHEGGLQILQLECQETHQTFINQVFDQLLREGRCYNPFHIKRICPECNTRTCHLRSKIKHPQQIRKLCYQCEFE
jgi:hypothetical protein